MKTILLILTIVFTCSVSVKDAYAYDTSPKYVTYTNTGINLDQAALNTDYGNQVDTMYDIDKNAYRIVFKYTAYKGYVVNYTNKLRKLLPNLDISYDIDNEISTVTIHH